MLICTRDVAQSGRALALGAKGPRFESLYPDHEFEDCGISSVVEQGLYTAKVGSSTLSSRTNFLDNRINLFYNTKHELRLGGEIGRHNRLKICRQKHAGSIPARGTILWAYSITVNAADS